MNTNVLERWQREGHPLDNNRAARAIHLRALYETLSTHLFQQYEPTKLPSSRASREFLLRIAKWLEKFQTEEQQWSAFRSIEYLFFAGHSEFEELYRCSVEHSLLPWLIDQSSIDIFSEEISDLLSNELHKCWICPVTDSLRINGFLHITGLPGQSLRPDWLSLREFADTEKIDKYVKKRNIEYLVLIEDFVGSGNQLSRAIRFAAEAFAGPILVMPLIICAPGERSTCDEIKKLNRSNIFYKPGLVIDDSCLVSRKPSNNEPKFFQKLRHAMKSGYEQMKVDLEGEEYGWQEIGSLAVLYSNCPNNTPPIFHYDTPLWNPLFPRISREKDTKK